MNHILETQNLSVGFGKKKILSDVSFVIGTHEIVSLIGVNGAGKTTLLKSIAGLVPLMSGEVIIDGLSVSTVTHRHLARLVSYLPQRLHITYPIRVKDFILLGRYPHVTSLFGYQKQDRLAVDDAISMLHLENFSERWMHELSGGEQQRVFLAGALAQKAKLIILDEPTVYLDPVQQKLLYETIVTLKQNSDVSFLIASHNIAASTQYSDRILSISCGGLIFDGPSSQFSFEESITATYGQDVTL
jgi:iron complex transport system ATP-binding protein